MPNSLGALNVVRLAQRRFREGDEFEVRYWKPSELERVFGRIGPTELSTDGFFTLNPQKRDLDLLPPRFRALVRVSEGLKAVHAPTTLADSVNIRSSQVVVALELVCPRDRSALRDGVCEQGHEYPVVDGIPVFLVDEEAPTHAACGKVEQLPPPVREGIDPFVQEVIGATCGRLYEHLIADLPEYPIPELRLPPGEGRSFLELGSNWGRWCVAATRRGYAATGIDPSLKGVQAARRVADQLGVDAQYVVGDARRLPFPDASVDVVFSYSVFQHFSKRDSLAAFDEIGRVLKPGGESLIQMANLYGAKSLWNQARERRFREPRTLFDVRYWGPHELQARARPAGRPDRAVGRRLLHAQPTADRSGALARALPRGRAHLGDAAPRLGDRQAADARRGQRLRSLASWVVASEM